jgi:hypothetical protein
MDPLGVTGRLCRVCHVCRVGDHVGSPDGYVEKELGDVVRR